MQIQHDQGLIPDLLETMKTDKGSGKFTCEKTLRAISENDPQLVYPYFDDVADLMDNPNSFIKWGAITILANLASVDKDHKFPLIYDKYFNLIRSDSMITAATAAGNAWKVVLAYPEMEKDITERLLQVEHLTYLNKGEVSPECQRILCGHVMDCFDKYFDQSEGQQKILEFVRGLTTSERKSVAAKAKKFLSRHLERNEATEPSR